ncbi:hypothetical protein FB446DRAFT_792838 [Lentinula raphanica]|nr:hypothetical protein FB446DRAFT_792838 [Lentinula raphanica]
MPPLQPIRPKSPRLCMLLGAFILFLSGHEYFGGGPAIKGVSAAPMNRNQDIPPAQPEQPELPELWGNTAQPAQHIDSNQYAHTEIPAPAWQWESDTARSAHPLHPNQYAPNWQLGSPAHTVPEISPTNWQPGGNLAHPAPQVDPQLAHSGIPLAQPNQHAHMEIQPGHAVHQSPAPPANQVDPEYVHYVHVPFELVRRAQDGRQRIDEKPVRSNEWWHARLGDLLMYALGKDKVIIRDDSQFGFHGKVMGTITFRSSTTMAKSLQNLIDELSKVKKDEFISNVFFIAFGIAFLEHDEDVVSVELNRDWFVMVSRILRLWGSGQGMEIPEKEVEKRKQYQEMKEKLNGLLEARGVSTKELAKTQLFDLNKIQL